MKDKTTKKDTMKNSNICKLLPQSNHTSGHSEQWPGISNAALMENGENMERSERPKTGKWVSRVSSFSTFSRARADGNSGKPTANSSRPRA